MLPFHDFLLNEIYSDRCLAHVLYCVHKRAKPIARANWAGFANAIPTSDVRPSILYQYLHLVNDTLDASLDTVMTLCFPGCYTSVDCRCLEPVGCAPSPKPILPRAPQDR